MSKRENGAVTRITATPETRKEFNAFRAGLGVSQEVALQALLTRVKLPGESAFAAGERLYKEWADAIYNAPDGIPS